MLKEGLLKENIDGEALEWAFKRIINRQEKEKNSNGYFRWSTS